MQRMEYFVQFFLYCSCEWFKKKFKGKNPYIAANKAKERILCPSWWPQNSVNVDFVQEFFDRKKQDVDIFFLIRLVLLKIFVES